MRALLASPPRGIDCLPVKVNDLAVYLFSDCAKVLNADTGTEVDKHPWYQIQFHAGILEGQFKGLHIVVTKQFSPIKVNPLSGVDLAAGMVVHVSGTLTAHHLPWSEIGVSAIFHLNAEVVKRDICYSEKRADYDKKRSAIDDTYRPSTNNFGAFECTLGKEKRGLL